MVNDPAIPAFILLKVFSPDQQHVESKYTAVTYTHTHHGAQQKQKLHFHLVLHISRYIPTGEGP